MNAFPFLLVLASTSPYRRMLLERFRLPFSVCSPNIDESAKKGETPSNLVTRLAEQKARAGAEIFAQSFQQQPSKMLVIGSDQVADCEGKPIGKPETHEVARQQLRFLSGKTVIFRTGLALFQPETGQCQCEEVDVLTTYRKLSDEEIDAYLLSAQPYNCAGAVRSEDHGIALFDRIESSDPTALIGLPLIALARLMRNAGANPLLYTGTAF